jgi:two-component system, cell cycle sensor histidine kinase and response regulator CckA
MRRRPSPKASKGVRGGVPSGRDTAAGTGVRGKAGAGSPGAGAPRSVRSLDRILNCIADPVFVKDEHHRMVLVNDAECALAGKPREELLGQTDDEVLSREQWERFWQQDDQVVATGLGCASEDEIPDPQGNVRTYITQKTRFVDAEGNRFVVGVLRDITQRKRDECAVQAAKDYAEKLIETANAMVVGLDAHGHIRVFNQAAERITGYTRAELEGRDWFEVIVPRERYPQVWAEFERMAGGGLAGEMENPILTKSGEERHIVWRNAVMGRPGDSPGTISFGIDVTERRQAEAGLRRNEERYRRFFQQDIAGTYVSTPDGRILDCNQVFAHILGYGSIEEVLEIDAGSRYPEPGARQAFLDGLRRHRGFDRHEAVYCRKDDSRVHVIESVVGVFDERDELVEIQGHIIDDTERRNAQEQLRLAQRMESVGRLAGGIAHDFNNVLTVIMGSAEMIRRRVPADHPAHRSAEDIRKAATRAASLTRQLLAYSRQQVLQPRVLDVGAVVAEMEGMLRQLLGAGIEIVTTRAAVAARVKADLGQLQQVILNLVINARDAMPRGGTITIEIVETELDASYAVGRGWAFKPGRYVQLVVSDTGCGMDAATRARVFDPFFTTKATGKGTGLGLATVYGIVKQSGGHIDIESEPGHGATFRIHLPRVDETLTVPGPVADAPGQGTETVLVVEDEELVRKVVCETLSAAGYAVLEAGSPGEAVALSAKHGGRVDLLVTDLVMPGRSGHDLVARMGELRPDMAVLCISGYADQTAAQSGQLGTETPFLQKPFTPDALLRKVRETLDEPRRKAA